MRKELALWLSRQTEESISHFLSSLPEKARQWATSLYFKLSMEDVTILRDYTFSLPIISIAAYLIFVFVAPKWMSNRKPFKLDKIYPAWNFFLWIVSLALFIGSFLPMSLRALNSSSVAEYLCDPHEEMWQPGSQIFWIHLFAYSKYFELGDTVLLILRKKEVLFLHWYHHITVLAYTWMAVYTRNDTGWYHGCLNALVHSFMYYYYWRASLKKTPKWGKFLTMFQTVQMVIGIAITTLYFYFHYTDMGCTCDHIEVNVISSIAMYGSYFILFALFYYQRYVGRKEAAKKKASEEAKAKTKAE